MGVKGLPKFTLHSYGVTTTYMCWWRVCCISHVTSCHGWNTRPIKACSIALKSNVTSSTARTSSTRWPWLDVVIRRYLSFLLKKISIIINVMFNLCHNHDSLAQVWTPIQGEWYDVSSIDWVIAEKSASGIQFS